MQRARQAFGHGAIRRRRAIQMAVPAKPATDTIPAAVAPPNPPSPRRSSLRSTVPSGTTDELVVDAGAVVDVVTSAAVEVELPVEVDDAGELDAGTEVVEVDVWGNVELDVLGPSVVEVAEGARAAAVVVGAGSAGGGCCSDARVVVSAVVGASVVVGAVVVVIGAGWPPLHSPGRIGLGVDPSIAAGGSKRGGRGSPVPIENDQPSIDPGGGVREPAPTVE
jgi:hypothetical protein